ncbi:PTS mannitol transporter subunit IICBA [Clostridium sp. CS001]|uniref:PTS mannitol transporter subunit IICBA n=1 Tax=Clostridium sp. CS001 TaxID=2880648 RepID=UPI001CF14368|nr:PTS mannitol transporter subunit IICBA [Clostridium sp. CS001]MCB2291766.1 PTS mannitol transporter subunit IICBA [Clostridium sp. CS001]
MEAKTQTELKPQSGFREKVQVFGRFLSGMVMPNIGAFIAWGLITALFIPTGWRPNENLAKLVGPMITYLLPLLISYTGGKIVGGTRGGVIGAIAAMGVIVGADIPMFIGAMIMGPLGGYVIKKFDKSIEGKIPAGFEMLVNNFSAGIIGMALSLLALLAIGPVVLALNNILKTGVEAIVNAGLLPLTSVFIEPGKILFLNNAINHGVLGPIGIQEAKEFGKSIFFLLEANPGPGLGILLAYWMFAKDMVKESAPGAIIIHFLGGIHEIYFPYVLMKPLLLLAVIGGGASGVFTFNLFHAGLVATPSPGSIFALIAMTPKGGLLAVLAGVIVSTVVSFLIASFFIKGSKDSEDIDLESAKVAVKDLKGSKKSDSEVKIANKTSVSKIVFACDAGMGSSAMGASTLRNKLIKAGFNIEVVNCAVDNIPKDAQVVITHESLAGRAKASAPKAHYIPVKDFLKNDAFEKLLFILAEPTTEFNDMKSELSQSSAVLRKENIKTHLESIDKYDAIRMAGRLLVDGGYVKEEYIEAMVEREKELTTYIGQGIAIPHGVGAAKKNIIKSGMVVLQYPEGVSFNGELAYILVGIAGVGNDHLGILANLATVIEEADEDMLNKLRNTGEVEFIYSTFMKE